MSDLHAARRVAAGLWLADLRQDLRYGLRLARASPGFTAVAVLTLGLGIGATTTIYSIVDTILVRPLPFAESDRLVRVIENVPAPGASVPVYQRGRTWQEYIEWRTRTTTLSEVIATAPTIGLVKTSQGTARLWGAMVSGSTFTMLGARAMLGRTLLPADETNPDTALLTHATWRRLFQSSPDIVGSRVEFLGNAGGARLMTVVGVMPADFEFPGERIEYFTPFTLGDADWKKYASINLIGRLRPGVSLDAAADEAMTIGTAIGKPLPGDAPAMTIPRFQVRTLKEGVVRELRPALRVFLTAVALVLLIVCANVANLLLARGMGRQREMAVRVAIGASRGRLVRQVLSECGVLATAGGVLGVLLGAVGIALVRQMASIDAPGVFHFSLGTSILPRIHEIDIDSQMFAVAFGVSALSIVAFGLLPALHLSRSSPVQAIGARSGGASRGAARLGTVLVVGQLVVATVLLVCAGLLIRSFGRLVTVDRGYDPSHALAFQLVFPPDYSIARKVATIEAILARLRTVPDIVASGFTRHGLMIGEQITIGTFVPQGRTRAEMEAQPVSPSLRPISGGYLTAVGARMIEGTDLDPLDSVSPPGIVISQRTARTFGQGRQIGRLVDWHFKEKVIQLQVVGIVSDLRNTRPEREPFPEVFIDYRNVLEISQQIGEAPLWQHERALGLLSFAVRMRGDAAAAVPTVRQIVRDADPNAGIDAIMPLEQLVSTSVARPRFYAVLLGVFAGVAALLAAIGIYGVLGYAVTQRTREIGVRMALGARRWQVLAPVLRHGLLLTIVGIAAGLALASIGTGLFQGLLFGVTPLDPVTFGAVSLLFGTVAAVASYVPARRATTVDPMVALRHE
jgi:putative ABC transport system permease protein